MTETTTIPSFDGTNLAVHRLGQGRRVLLLHGLFSGADMNWIRYGHAQKLADAGFEAIMPDLRAHGKSEAPREPAAYPPDVLVQDVRALVMALELEDYDLTVGSFDDPSDFRPKHHFGAESMLHESWLDTKDLKRVRTDEHALLMEKWRASGEAPPSV